MVFSPKTKEVDRDWISESLNIKPKEDLGKYLAFPIHHRRVTKQDYDFVVEKVRAKLAGWRANLLSPAGRLVLIQATTAAIPNYYMQGRAPPKATCKALDRINRNFLWAGTEDTRKIDRVGWNKVIAPKDQGGLNIQDTHYKNLAQSMRGLIQEKDKLWSKTLTAKYLGKARQSKPRTKTSPTWRAPRGVSHLLEKGLRWVVSSGATTNFWGDNWTGLGPLRQRVEGPLTLNEEKLLVRDVLQALKSGEWLLSYSFPTEVMRKIRSTPLTICDTIENNQDTLCGSLSKSGQFSLQSAYNLVKEQYTQSVGDDNKVLQEMDLVTRSSSKTFFFPLGVCSLSPPSKQ